MQHADYCKEMFFTPPAFDVLDPSFSVHRSCLVEASAGTGKTFSIQHLLTRLLIEEPECGEPFSITDCLIMTFTRAATRELKQRLRAQFLNALSQIESLLLGQTDGKPCPPPYLLQKDRLFLERGRRSLKRALLLFDEAQIFTIHGFCGEMLRRHAPEERILGAKAPPTLLWWTTRFQEFLAHHHIRSIYSQAQLHNVLQADPEQKSLLKALSSHLPIHSPSSFQEDWHQFTTLVAQMRTIVPKKPEEIIEAFDREIDLYRTAHTKLTKAELRKQVVDFASLFATNSLSMQQFDQIVEWGVAWPAIFDPLHRKKASSPIPLVTQLSQYLKKEWLPFVQRVRDPSALILRGAYHFRKFLDDECPQTHLSHDSVIEKVRSRLHDGDFTDAIRQQYRVVIVDEFQDTDPRQWEILNTLFLPKVATAPQRHFVYLVGDPKQSIYAFRYADIYTYCDAAERLGSDARYSLRVNYRSQERLVHALNHLFGEKNVSHLFSLPKRQQTLPFPSAIPHHKASASPLQDNISSVHWIAVEGDKRSKKAIFSLEEEVILPWIIEELLRIKSETNIAWNQCAILVRDHYQGSRATRALQQAGIPTLHQRSLALSDSPTIDALVEILEAIHCPSERGKVIRAMGGKLLRRSHEELLREECIQSHGHWFEQLQQLFHTLTPHAFFKTLLEEQSYALTVSLKTLLHMQAMDRWRELQQLVFISLEAHGDGWRSLQELIDFLKTRPKIDQDAPEWKRFENKEGNGVHLMTLHVSKGLEFDIVFPVALLIPTSNQEEFGFDDTGRLCSLQLNAQQQQERNAEIDAEKIRQLYVACTRAKWRLYIPYILFQSAPQDDNHSSLSLYFEKLLQKQCCATEREALFNLINSSEGTMSISLLNNASKPSVQQHAPNTCALPTPLPHDAGLKRHVQRNEQKKHSSAKNDQRITLQSYFERCVRRFLATVSFSALQPLTTPEAYLPYVAPFFQRIADSAMLHQVSVSLLLTLTQPLPHLRGNIRFVDIEQPGRCIKGLHFVLPKTTLQIQTEALTFSGHAVQGVLDMIFEHDGQWYFLDWKTYGKQHDESGAIYEKALKNYLKRFPSSQYGGGYHLVIDTDASPRGWEIIHRPDTGDPV